MQPSAVAEPRLRGERAETRAEIGVHGRAAGRPGLGTDGGRRDQYRTGETSKIDTRKHRNPAAELSGPISTSASTSATSRTQNMPFISRASTRETLPATVSTTTRSHPIFGDPKVSTRVKLRRTRPVESASG